MSVSLHLHLFGEMVVHLNNLNGHIISPSGLPGKGGEFLTGLLGGTGQNNILNFFLRHMAQPVGAEQKILIAVNRHLVHGIDLNPQLNPQRPGQHRPSGGFGGFLGPGLLAGQHFQHPGMILGQLFNLAHADAVNPAIADMRNISKFVG